MEADVGQAIVVATPTIMDGLVLRWYRSLDAAAQVRPVLSASRNGVSVHAEFLTDAPQGWITEAMQAYQLLREDKRDDAQALATHRHTRLFGKELEPTQPPATTQ